MCLEETLTLKIFVKPFPCTLFSHYSQNISFTLTVAINITFRFTLIIPIGTRHPNPYLLLYVDILTLTINLILTLGNLNFIHCCQTNHAFLLTFSHVCSFVAQVCSFLKKITAKNCFANQPSKLSQ